MDLFAWLAIAGIALLILMSIPGIKAWMDTKKDTTEVKVAGVKSDISLKAAALQDDLQAFLSGLGIIQDVKVLKGDFDASAALFLNRALSHGVAKIVRTEDQAQAAKCYADAALLIAAAGTVTQTT